MFQATLPARQLRAAARMSVMPLGADASWRHHCWKKARAEQCHAPLHGDALAPLAWPKRSA